MNPRLGDGSAQRRAASSTCCRSPRPAPPSTGCRSHNCTAARRRSAASTARRARRATPAPTSSTRPPRSRSPPGRAGRSRRRDVQFRFASTEPGVDLQCQLTGPGQTGGFAACYKSNAQPTPAWRRHVHVLGARDRRRVPEPAGRRRARSRSTRARHDDHRRPDRARPTTRRRRSPSPATGAARRSSAALDGARVRGLHLAAHDRRAGARARTPSRCARSTPPATPTRRPPRATFTVDTVAPDTTITSGPTRHGATHQRDVHVLLDRGRRDVRVLARRRARSGLPAPATPGLPRARTRSRSAPSTPPATPTRRPPRAPGRSTRSRRTRRSPSGPSGPTARAPRATFTFTVDRGRRDVRVRARRRRVRDLPVAAATPASPTARTPSRSAPSTPPGNVDATPATQTLDGRHRRAGHDDRRAARRGRRATRRRRSRSRSSEAGATFQCRARRRRVRRLHARRQLHRASPRARTRSRCARSTPPATSTRRPATQHVDRRHDRAGHDDHHRPDAARRNDTTRDASPSRSSEAGATFECSLDGAAFAACPSRRSRPAAQPRARHTFEVRAVDAAGNVDATPATRPGPSTPSRRTRRSPAARPARPTTRRRPSRSPRPRPARRSSAGSTAAAFAACTSPPRPHGADRRRAHVRGPRDRRRPATPTPTPAGARSSIDTDRAGHDDHGGPRRAEQRPRRRRSSSRPTRPARRFECRARRRRVRRLRVAVHDRTSWPTGTHTFDGARRRRRRQRRCDAGDSRTFTIDTDAAGHDDRRGRPARRATTSADVHVHLQRVPADVRVLARRRRVRAAARRRYTRPLRRARTRFEVRATDAAGNTDATPAPPHAGRSTRSRRDTTIDRRADRPDQRPPRRPSPSRSTESRHDVRVRARRRRLRGLPAPLTTTALAAGHAHASRSAPSTSPATPTRRRPRGRGRSTPSRRTRRSPPARRGTGDARRRDVHVHLDRGRRDVPVLARRRRVRRLPAPATPASREGSHTFAVRAIDAAGNIDATPPRARGPSTRPRPRRRSPGRPGRRTTTTPTFTFSSSEAGATFECRVDTGAFTSCTSPHTTVTLAHGAPHVRGARHRCRRQPRSRRRRRGRSPSIRRPPTRRSSTSPDNNALLIANTVAFNGTAEPGTTVELREGTTLTGSAIASGTGLWTIVMGAVPDGTHTYAARAIDAATNASSPTTRTVTVDTGAPGHDDHRRPERPGQRRHADVHVLVRGGRDVRVQHRRGRPHGVPEPVHDADAQSGPAHALGPRGRPRRQPRQHARDPELLRRHRRARDDDQHRPERPDQQHRAAGHLQRQRARRDVRVPARHAERTPVRTSRARHRES